MNPMAVAAVHSLLERQYRLNGPLIVKVLAPYKAFLRHGSGDLLLKRHATMTPDMSGPVEDVYSLCIKHGLCPDFVRSKEGRILVPDCGFVYSLQRLMVREPCHVGGKSLAQLLTMFHSVMSHGYEDNISSHFDTLPVTLEAAVKLHGLGRFTPLVQEIDSLRAGNATVVHGDLHPGNVIFSGGSLFLLDLDSAASSVPEIDVAFAAFRFFGHDEHEQEVFLRECGVDDLQAGGIWKFLAYSILQRLVFILESSKRGDDRWNGDLGNQERYLMQAEALMKGAV